MQAERWADFSFERPVILSAPEVVQNRKSMDRSSFLQPIALIRHCSSWVDRGNAELSKLDNLLQNTH